MLTDTNKEQWEKIPSPVSEFCKTMEFKKALKISLPLTTHSVWWPNGQSRKLYKTKTVWTWDTSKMNYGNTLIQWNSKLFQICPWSKTIPLDNNKAEYTFKVVSYSADQYHSLASRTWDMKIFRSVHLS
jgi:hypothetical protein